MKKVTTAFVLGAGLGTRLRPLTDTCPKPLLKIHGRPMIVHVFDRLASAGITRFIVNTHHCAAAYSEMFPGNAWNGLPISFRHEPALLGTAGGLKNIEDLAGQEALLLHSGDVLTNLPIEPLLQFHEKQNAEATLALRTRQGIETVGLHPGGRIGSVGRAASRGNLDWYDYANIAVIEPAFFRRIPDTQPRELARVWSDMAAHNAPLFGLPLNEGYWFNVGTVEEYQKLNDGSFPPNSAP